MNNNTLLIVDDEQNIINSIKRELRGENYLIYDANSAKEGLYLLKKKDKEMQTLSGKDLIRNLWMHSSKSRIRENLSKIEVGVKNGLKI